MSYRSTDKKQCFFCLCITPYHFTINYLCNMLFEIVGKITGVQIIAAGGNIRDIMRIQKQFGLGRWRKLKGFTDIRLPGGEVRRAEIHWYEAHGIGKKKFKIKHFIGRKYL